MIRDNFFKVGVVSIRSKQYKDGSYHEYSLEERSLSEDEDLVLCVVDRFYKGARDSSPIETIITDDTSEEAKECMKAFFYNFPSYFGETEQEAADGEETEEAQSLAAQSEEAEDVSQTEERLQEEETLQTY